MATALARRRAEPVASSDLIYDVGLYDGADTAYYLFRGYRVVAIDANPLMIEGAQGRFAKEIGEERLTLLNIGIGPTPGEATFWVSDHADWSSFDREIAARNDQGHQPVPVPIVPFSDLLDEYGTPHYLKIDIEGNDRLCVEALKGKNLPKYISVEAECARETEVLSDEQAVAILELLRDVGYRRFKLVNQNGWGPVQPTAARFRARLIHSAARGRLRKLGLSRIAQKFVQAPITSLGFPFAGGSSSGPWGDDIPSVWMTFTQARSIYLKTRHAYFSRPELLYSFWYDWHATY
ncbi:MAG: FkbM family methyltransferase [Acidobacteriia bacterium]|nr:FkbM family methyltransferase [Terriglobia bacterium]